MEGSIGPVAGSSQHSIYYKMPGVKIISPMTPKEYLIAYNDFMKNDDVMYVSEHRGSYANTKELSDHLEDNLDLILLWQQNYFRRGTTPIMNLSKCFSSFF